MSGDSDSAVTAADDAWWTDTTGVTVSPRASTLRRERSITASPLLSWPDRVRSGPSREKVRHENYSKIDSCFVAYNIRWATYQGGAVVVVGEVVLGVVVVLEQVEDKLEDFRRADTVRVSQLCHGPGSAGVVGLISVSGFHNSNTNDD